MNLMRQINVASAAFPGYRHRRSMELAYAGLQEAFGDVSLEHAQICPQHSGVMDEAAAEELCEAFSATQFRLHANVRVEPAVHVFDASTPWALSEPYFKRLAAVNRVIGGQAYSLHAGRAETADLATMADNVRRVEETFEIAVAVEGLYPDPATAWLLSSWQDYTWLLGSGLKWAIDLSHLNILVHRSRERHDDLVRELVSSERCLEVHVSTNRGYRDEHRPVDGTEWWWDLMSSVHPDAVIFTEGMHRQAKPV